MKKVYVSLLLDVVTFEQEDVIRTSLNAATQLVEKDVDFTKFFE